MTTAEAMTKWEPKKLGFWIRCLRETTHWSQEALAASSGLDVRTIQRVEAGVAASITTRRAIARALGYDDANTFDDPNFIRAANNLLDGVQNEALEAQKAEFEKQFPDHMPVKASLVTTGQQLGELAGRSDSFLFQLDNEITEEAKDQAAAIFDYVRDLGDVADCVSFADLLSYHRELDSMIGNLRGVGASIYMATRSAKIVGENWVNKTPLPIAVGYLTVLKDDKELEEMMVPRRIS